MLLGAGRVHGIPTAIAAGLLPAAAGVLVNISVCAGIHVAVCSLSRAGAIPVGAARTNGFSARRSLYRSRRPLCRGIVLRVGALAVL